MPPLAREGGEVTSPGHLPIPGARPHRGPETERQWVKNFKSSSTSF